MSDKQKKILHDLVDIVADNAALLFTIGYAGYIIYRHDIAKEDVPIDQLLTAILWVIGFLAISEIVERYRKLNAIHNSVERSVHFLESRLTDRPSAMAFFQKPPNIRSYLERATQIDLCGVTLTSTLNKEYGTIRDRLQAGARIRIMLIDPESNALDMTAQRSMNPDDLDYYRIRLESSLRELAYIFKFVDTTKSIGVISVRLLSYAPSFGIVSLDSKEKDGVTLIDIYPHKFGYEVPPTFDLIPERDQDWHAYFVKQFEIMWDAAKPWDPKPYVDKIPLAKAE
jgi:hypothetical protein